MKSGLLQIFIFVSHKAEFLWKPRGFNSVDEMNEAIIENWNSVVKPGDIVYNLGDSIMSDNEKGVELYKKLNGTSFMIWGNHCTDNKKNLLAEHCHIVGGLYALLIKYNKLSIYMSHYPTLTCNYDEKHFNQHVLSLHGHVHSRTPWIDLRNPFMYDVGMDAHNCTPVHIDEIITDIRQRWEEIGRLPVPVQPQDTYPYGGLINEN